MGQTIYSKDVADILDCIDIMDKIVFYHHEYNTYRIPVVGNVSTRTVYGIDKKAGVVEVDFLYKTHFIRKEDIFRVIKKY